MVQTAIKELGQCSDIDLEDLKAALIKQAQIQAQAGSSSNHRAAVLGDVELQGLNDCLRTLQQQQQQQGEVVDPECQTYLDKLDAKAESDDGSPGYKIAWRLKNDPKAYCGCIERIDVGVGPDCTGWGVVRVLG